MKRLNVSSATSGAQTLHGLMCYIIFLLSFSESYTDEQQTERSQLY